MEVAPVGDNCTDNIGRPSLEKLMKEARNGNDKVREESEFLLKNRYRIFLTRGIKGTCIYCEDGETLEYLLKLD